MRLSLKTIGIGSPDRKKTFAENQPASVNQKQVDRNVSAVVWLAGCFIGKYCFMVDQPSDTTFRYSFYGGLILAVIVGVWLVRLWEAENQVRLHTEHLLGQIEERDWAGAGDFLAVSYHDDWGDDRQRMINRLRLGVRFFSNLTITPTGTQIHLQEETATWSARIQLAGSGSEMAPEAVEEINRLTTPFELRWKKQSWKPWDWKLVQVRNSELQLPADVY